MAQANTRAGPLLVNVSVPKKALSKSENKEVRAFAEDMVRDHTAVNNKALDLVKKLNVTPGRTAKSDVRKHSQKI